MKIKAAAVQKSNHHHNNNSGVRAVEKQTNKTKCEKNYVQAIAKVLGRNHHHSNVKTTTTHDNQARTNNFTNGAKLKETLVACYKKKRGRHKKEKPAAPAKTLSCKMVKKKKKKTVAKETKGKGVFLPHKSKSNAPPSRVHRMASLNAMAKVHILYENESRLGPNDGIENAISMCEEKKKSNTGPCRNLLPVKKEPKEPVTKNGPKSNCKVPEKERSKRVSLPVPVPVKRKRNRKPLGDVEIIDTRACRRLASLNAQAILAASYSVERSRKDRRSGDRDEKLCFGKEEILTYDHKISSITTQTTCTYFQQKQAAAVPERPLVREQPTLAAVARSELPGRSERICRTLTKEKKKAAAASSEIEKPRTATVSKVGLTHYTEVTQVHMTKEVKEEVKAKRTVERYLEKDDVAITRMYRYQSKAKGQSYCLQMQTTYQPLPTTPPSDYSLPDSPSPVGSGQDVSSPASSPTQGNNKQCLVDNVVHSNQGNAGYYGGYTPSSPPVGMQGGQDLPVGTSGPAVPAVPMARHYGSAFTVPHYGPPSAVSYPGGDYGYYQPSGGVVQHEQCTIHKPVPYHPQHIRHTSPPPPPPAHHPHHHHHSTASTHLPPPAHNPYPPSQDQCGIPHHGYPQQQHPSYSQEPSPCSYTPVSPYGHCRGGTQRGCIYSPPNYHREYHQSSGQYQVMAPTGPTACHRQPSPSHQINTVPKTEPTTPPELKPNGYGSPFSTYDSVASDLPPKIDCDSPCPEFCRQCQRQEKDSVEPVWQGPCKTSRRGISNIGPKSCKDLSVVVASASLAPPAKKSRKSPEVEVAPAEPPVQVPRPGLGGTKKKPLKRFSNGWSWEGEPFDKLVFLCNDDAPCLRKCYPSMRHIEGDTIGIRDCVLLKSGPRKVDLPFVAKVTALWETPDEGEMMMSLMWYYRPEHTEQGRRNQDVEAEIFASKHRDVNSVACIEDKCYVLTFSEYCRYKANMKMLEENVRSRTWVVPERDDLYPRKVRMPPGCVSLEMVFFCRKVYDFRQKRILKNPT